MKLFLFAFLVGISATLPCGAEDPTFAIMLGDEMEPGDKPFLDAYELSQSISEGTGILLDVRRIETDTETAIPMKTGVYALVHVPKDADELPKKIVQELLRAGITYYERLQSKDDSALVKIRVGIHNGQFRSAYVAKYYNTAELIMEQGVACRIELYDADKTLEKIRAQHREKLAGEMGAMMGGMMGGGAGGMLGDEGYGGMGDMMGMDTDMDMDMDMGMGMGMGGYGDFHEDPFPNAKPKGLMETGELMLVWDLSKRQVAAISLTAGGGWKRMDLPSGKMTEPTASKTNVAFFCGNHLYGFTASTGSWDVLKLKERPQETFSVTNNAIILETQDDVHIFTSVSGKWWSRSTRPANSDRGSVHVDMPLWRTLSMGTGVKTETELDQAYEDFLGDNSSEANAPQTPQSSPPADVTIEPGQVLQTPDPNGYVNLTGRSGLAPLPSRHHPKRSKVESELAARVTGFVSSNGERLSIEVLKNKLGAMKEARKSLESQISAHMTQLQNATSTAQHDSLANHLKTLHEKLFDAKLDVDLLELYLLQQRVNGVASKIESRFQNKDKIVSKRLNELMEIQQLDVEIPTRR